MQETLKEFNSKTNHNQIWKTKDKKFLKASREILVLLIKKQNKTKLFSMINFPSKTVEARRM